MLLAIASSCQLRASRDGFTQSSWLSAQSLPTNMNTTICHALEKRQRLQFIYNGKTRVVEPQCYGVSARGTELLRGYEVRGGVEMTNKLYDLSKATSLTLLNEYFTLPGPNYQKNDSAMKTIFCEL
jgi:hypothetical protein